MSKPMLVIITGRPASGKTTLAHLLSQKINYPLVSRDELKEGYINTFSTAVESHHLTNLHVNDVFFKAIEFFISHNISIIIEAAFQHKLWKPNLEMFTRVAEMKIINCATSLELTVQRFNERLKNNVDRLKFHGDEVITEPALYQQLNIHAPTLPVDTTNNYQPDIETIISFIKSKQ